jgi:hypothetical protein
MIGELGGEHMGQQSRPCHAAIYRPCGRRGLYDQRASCTAQLRTHVADDQEASGNIIQHLGNILAQLPQDAAALRTVLLLRKMGVDFTPQMRRQRTPLRYARTSSLRGRLLLCMLHLNSSDSLQSFELEFQLLDLPGHLLRLAPELRAPQLSND